MQFLRRRPAPTPETAPSHCQLVGDAIRTERCDLVALANALDIRVVMMKMRPDLCGFISREGAHWAIHANADHPATRIRFTLAHMIGHHFFHRDLMHGPASVQGVNDGKNYRQVPGMPFENPRILVEHEMQASRFAISLVMPEAIVERLRDDGLDCAAIAERLECTPAAIELRLAGIDDDK